MAVSHVDPDIEVVLPALKQLQKGRKRALSGSFCETDNTKAICGTCQEKVSRGGKSVF